jgi:hypothetical protein
MHKNILCVFRVACHFLLRRCDATPYEHFANGDYRTRLPHPPLAEPS